MLAPGTLLSARYRIQSVLGQGGMGAVYLAHQEALGDKKVAVKEMELKGFTAQELAQAVSQFNREASFLANLDHPNLVPVTDFFIEGDKHYLVMAYVNGQTLQQLLKAQNRPFTWTELKKWASPLVEVLAYLHSQNPPILFRDLKPSNIMVEENGRLRLIDFGIARTAQAGDRTSTFLQGTGTTGFSPIEQYGGGQSTDQRSDIYALGATFYYLLTGKVPPDAVARASLGQEVVPPSRLQNGLSTDIDHLLLKALAVRQHERHNSMAEFRSQMESIRSEIDEEEPTENFGALPAVGATTVSVPSTAAPVTSRPTSIVVEMFPTTPAQPGGTSGAVAPLLAGTGALLAAGFATFYLLSQFTGSSSPVAAERVTVAAPEAGSVPLPLDSLSSGDSLQRPPEAAQQTQTAAKPQTQNSTKRPRGTVEPVRTAAPTNPVPRKSTAQTTTSSTRVSTSSLGEKTYPRAISYPKATNKPQTEESAPSQPVSTPSAPLPEQPVATKEPPRYQPPAQQGGLPPEWRPGMPLPGPNGEWPPPPPPPHGPGGEPSGGIPGYETSRRR